MAEKQTIIALNDGLPSRTSDITIKTKQKIEHDLQLSTLISDITRLGNCIRIAYHALSGVGFAELQNQVQMQGFDVVRLCNKSSATIYAFKEASSRVLDTLEASYEYLLEGFEEMAIIGISEMSTTAEKMHQEAEKLQQDFEIKGEEVIKLAAAANSKSEEVQKKEFKKQKEDLEAEKEQKERIIKAIIEERDFSKQLLKQAEQRQEAAESDLNGMKNIVNIFTNQFFGAPVYDMSVYRDIKKEEKEKRKQHEKRIRDLEEKRLESIKAVEAVVIKSQEIGANPQSERSATAAVKALLQAKRALQDIGIIIEHICFFWDLMKKECDEMKKEKIKVKIEKVQDMPQDRRQAFYNSKGFRKEAHEVYGYWVALNAVCNQCKEQMVSTQKSLYENLKEAFLPAEAYQKIQELAPQILQDCKKAKEHSQAMISAIPTASDGDNDMDGSWHDDPSLAQTMIVTQKPH